ncbi:MAG TPA: anti-sigma factor [Gaiellaceae bacterium]|nr:anti-sigma factor [Gaiellaceae bacterium]
MTERRPDFDALVPDDLGSSERERLRRVHDALVAAGPPEELPSRLAHAPDVQPRVVPLRPRWRPRLALIAAAAAISIAVFAAGFSAGDHHATPSAVKTVTMAGSPLAQDAHASLALFKVDSAGNWPMKLTVSGLEPAKSGRPFELWLTRHGKPLALCGSFVPTRGGTASVPMNAPYKLTEYDGWVVVEEGSMQPVLTTA